MQGTLVTFCPPDSAVTGEGKVLPYSEVLVCLCLARLTSLVIIGDLTLHLLLG